MAVTGSFSRGNTTVKLNARRVFSLCVMAAVRCLTTPLAEAKPVVWIAPSLHRVGMAETPGNGSEVRLSAARGEVESFQIVAHGSSAGLAGVNVTVSDLHGPDGQTIPRSSFTLYREKYMQVTSSSPNWKGSNQPLGPGWYADALIP